MRPLWILGAGGHAKVVIATARAAGFGPLRAADDASSRWGTEILGVPIVGPIDEVLEQANETAVLAIGSNRGRHELGTRARCQLAVIVHPSAVIDSTVQLGSGTVVFAGCVIQPDSVLGTNVIVNTHASIDHDGRIEDSVHIAPGVHLAGTVTVRQGAFLGIGTAVTPGRTIGQWATVGAGGVVIRDIPDGKTAIGVPARVVVARPPTD